ncbi:asparagine-rich protein, partial [Reticulomyxa filosa]
MYPILDYNCNSVTNFFVKKNTNKKLCTLKKKLDSHSNAGSSIVYCHSTRKILNANNEVLIELDSCHNNEILRKKKLYMNDMHLQNKNKRGVLKAKEKVSTPVPEDGETNEEKVEKTKEGLGVGVEQQVQMEIGPEQQRSETKHGNNVNISDSDDNNNDNDDDDDEEEGKEKIIDRFKLNPLRKRYGY